MRLKSFLHLAPASLFHLVAAGKGPPSPRPGYASPPPPATSAAENWNASGTTPGQKRDRSGKSRPPITE
jgi:hypothetical protein